MVKVPVIHSKAPRIPGIQSNKEAGWYVSFVDSDKNEILVSLLRTAFYLDVLLNEDMDLDAWEVCHGDQSGPWSVNGHRLLLAPWEINDRQTRCAGGDLCTCFELLSDGDKEELQTINPNSYFNTCFRHGVFARSFHMRTLYDVKQYEVFMKIKKWTCVEVVDMNWQELDDFDETAKNRSEYHSGNLDYVLWHDDLMDAQWSYKTKCDVVDPFIAEWKARKNQE